MKVNNRAACLGAMLLGAVVGSAACVAGPGAALPLTQTDTPSASASPVAATAAPTPSPDGTPTTQTFETGAYPPARFWLGVVPGGNNVEHFVTLDAMTASSDAVVVASLVSIGQDPDRHTSLDPADGAFAQLTFRVEEVVAGTVNSITPGNVVVEIFYIDAREYARFATKLPGDRVLMFLRNKAVEAKANGWPAEGPDAGSQYYRVVSDQGLIRDVGGHAQPAEIDGGFLETLNGTAFADVLSSAKAAAHK